MRKTNQQLIESRHNKLMLSLGALSGLLVLYFVFLGQVFAFSVDRQEALQEIAELEPQVASMEFKYLSLTASVDPEMAANMGYVPVDDGVIFASIDKLNVALSPTENGI